MNHVKCVGWAWGDGVFFGKQTALVNSGEVRMVCLEEVGEFSAQVKFESFGGGFGVNNFQGDRMVFVPSILGLEN